MTSKIIGKFKKQPMAETTGQVVTPVGGGSASVNITVDALHYVNAVLEVQYTSLDPDVTMYKEKGVHVSGNSVGMTIGSAAGSTVGLRIYTME